MIADGFDFFLTVAGLILSMSACCSIVLVPQLTELVNFASVTARLGSPGHPVFHSAPLDERGISLISEERVGVYMGVTGICTKYEIQPLGYSDSLIKERCYPFYSHVLHQDEDSICEDVGGLESANISAACEALGVDRYTCSLSAMGKRFELPSELRRCDICTTIAEEANKAKRDAIGVIRSLCNNTDGWIRNTVLLLTMFLFSLLKFCCYCHFTRSCAFACVSRLSTVSAAVVCMCSACVATLYYLQDYPISLLKLFTHFEFERDVSPAADLSLGLAFYCCILSSATSALSCGFSLLVCCSRLKLPPKVVDSHLHPFLMDPTELQDQLADPQARR